MWPFKAKAKDVAPSVTLEGNRDGETFVAEFDYERLNAQMKKVYNVVKTGDWITLRELSDAVAAPEASVSARLRDFRKPNFGALKVERRRRDKGLYEYRLLQDN